MFVAVFQWAADELLWARWTTGVGRNEVRLLTSTRDSVTNWVLWYTRHSLLSCGHGKPFGGLFTARHKEIGRLVPWARDSRELQFQIFRSACEQIQVSNTSPVSRVKGSKYLYQWLCSVCLCIRNLFDEWISVNNELERTLSRQNGSGFFWRTYRLADNSRPVSFTASAWEPSLCYKLIVYRLQRETREREINGQTARGRSIQYTNNSDPITSTSELLLRQNSVTAHAHQS
jgi:hypothetical protein